MRQHTRHRRIQTGLVVCALCLAGPAQAQHVLHLECCPTIPWGAIPAPNGYFVRGWQQAQASRAAADDFVIYSQEWYMGGQTLGPYGQYHIGQIAKRLPHVPFPVVLQPDGRHEMNEVRRLLIVQHLLQCGIADAEARVVIAFPEAEGLYGVETPRIYGRMFTGQTGGGTGIGIGTGGGAPPFSGASGSLGIMSRGF